MGLDDSQERGRIEICYCGESGNETYVVGAIRKGDRTYDVSFCCEEHQFVWKSLGNRRAVQEGRLELLTKDETKITQVADKYHNKK